MCSKNAQNTHFDRFKYKNLVILPNKDKHEIAIKFKSLASVLSLCKDLSNEPLQIQDSLAYQKKITERWTDVK
jgi:hypothetical protein